LLTSVVQGTIVVAWACVLY